MLFKEYTEIREKLKYFSYITQLSFSTRNFQQKNTKTLLQSMEPTKSKKNVNYDFQ